MHAHQAFWGEHIKEAKQHGYEWFQRLMKMKIKRYALSEMYETETEEKVKLRTWKPMENKPSTWEPLMWERRSLIQRGGYRVGTQEQEE